MYIYTHANIREAELQRQQLEREERAAHIISEKLATAQREAAERKKKDEAERDRIAAEVRAKSVDAHRKLIAMQEQKKEVWLCRALLREKCRALLRRMLGFFEKNAGFLCQDHRYIYRALLRRMFGFF